MMSQEDNLKEINKKNEKNEESQKTVEKAAVLLDDDDLDQVSGGMKCYEIPERVGV